MKKVLLVLLIALFMVTPVFAMTKAELLKDLGDKEFVSSVGTPELIETKPDGTKLYIVNIREVVGKAAIYRNIFFYVVDEGGAKETAYYKDRETKQSLPDEVIVTP